jgi:cysteinyl-tRNA synthetase
LETLKPAAISTSNITELKKKCYEAMNDDFNSPILVANLFEGVRIINSVNDGKETITAADLKTLKELMHAFIFDVMGLKSEQGTAANDAVLNNVMEIILNMRQEIKTKKDFAAADKLRDDLKKNKITVKDTKDGAVWAIEG